MPRINIAKSWDILAPVWLKKNEHLFKKGLLWGPLGPYERTVKLLPSVRSKKVLVAGCGSGPDMWWLAKQGARVTGIDISERQLEFAKGRIRQAGLKAEFRRLNLDKLPRTAFNKETFDIIISNYAFQYVGNIPKLFATLFYWTKKGGLLIFSRDHPLIFATWRHYLHKKSISIRRHFDYFKERRRVWPWRVASRQVPYYTFHQTISSIHNALTGAGFIVEKIFEPKPTIKPMEDYRKDTEIARHIPYTIIFVARKQHFYPRKNF